MHSGDVWRATHSSTPELVRIVFTLPVCFNDGCSCQVHQQYGQATGLAQQLESKLGELQRISQQMDSTWRMRVLRENYSNRDIWKLKVEQVSEETDALRIALEKHTHKERRCERQGHLHSSCDSRQWNCICFVACRRRIEEAERADLLSRSGANGPGGWRATMDDDTQAMSYVQNSKRVLEETFQTGTAILTNMAGQRERLKARRSRLPVCMGLNNETLLSPS